jgi:hypothetical protein
MSSKPTKEESRRLDALHNMPCVINNHDCGGGIQAHHLTSGGRRLGHMFTIPLCKWHHHWDSPLPIGDAYGKGKKSWIAKHGTEKELLEKTNLLLEGLE